MRKQLFAVDLFSGAGGMSLGAHMAGITVMSAVDSDPWAAKTYIHNFPNTNFLNKDIRDISSTDLVGKIKPDMLFGGPPCQGFSTSNQKTRNAANPNNWLFEEYFRLVKELSPTFVIFENVKGIRETEGGMFLDQAIECMRGMGYKTNYWLLNAVHFGVPQRRERIFIIGSKIELPDQPKNNLNSGFVTVKEAIGDLPILENGASVSEREYNHRRENRYTKHLKNCVTSCKNHFVTKNSPLVISRYRHVPQGGNWENIPARLMNNYKDSSRCHTGIYHRLNANKPSVVVGNYRKNMLIHPTQDRGLSVREAARLQSFPDWYEFSGSIGFQQQQVGNAVPPLLAKSVFNAIC